MFGLCGLVIQPCSVFLQLFAMVIAILLRFDFYLDHCNKLPRLFQTQIHVSTLDWVLGDNIGLRLCQPWRLSWGPNRKSRNSLRTGRAENQARCQAFGRMVLLGVIFLRSEMLQPYEWIVHSANLFSLRRRQVANSWLWESTHELLEGKPRNRSDPTPPSAMCSDSNSAKTSTFCCAVRRLANFVLLRAL